MGYEHKIYVVTKSNYIESDNKRFAEVIAMFNFGKYGELESIFKKDSDCYIYAADGNTKILFDEYGKNLTECSINEIIEFLENEVNKGQEYRRIQPLLCLLKGFNVEQWGNLAVLHYGC